MLINMDRISVLLWIAHPTFDLVIFCNVEIDKAYIFEIIEKEGLTWCGKLPTSKCDMVLRVLNIILVHNLLPTTHQTDMIDNLVHLVVSLMEDKSIDFPTIMCYVMLQATLDRGSKRGLPYGVMITQLIEQHRVTLPCDVVVLP